MNPVSLVVGGDRRQFWLARSLPGRVFTLGVPGCPDEPPAEPVDRLILPCPCLDRTGTLNCPGLDLGDLGPWCGPATRVYGGVLPGDLAARLSPCGAVVDLLEDPAVVWANARLTAEGAVALIWEAGETSLAGKAVGVLGYGRVGKTLAPLLAALGARVTVAARRAEVRAEAKALGFDARDFSFLPPLDLICNTVPAPALSAAALERLGPDCLWVELASAPGGLPQGRDWPFPRLSGASLPGKRLPRGAAAALLAGILEHEVRI